MFFVFIHNAQATPPAMETFSYNVLNISGDFLSISAMTKNVLFYSIDRQSLRKRSRSHIENTIDVFLQTHSIHQKR